MKCPPIWRGSKDRTIYVCGNMVVVKEGDNYIGKIKFRHQFIYECESTDLRSTKQKIMRARELLGRECTKVLKRKSRVNNNSGKKVYIPVKDRK